MPLGAAVQSSNYSVADKKRNALGRGYTKLNGMPIVLTPEDEIPFPIRAHLRLAQEKLKVNYLFWATHPRKDFERVREYLAEPDIARDPAGGLDARIPRKAFRR